MKNYKEIKVHVGFWNALAEELQHAIKEREELINDGRFAEEFPNLTKSIKNEIEEFNYIVKQLKS